LHHSICAAVVSLVAIELLTGMAARARQWWTRHRLYCAWRQWA
jgi:hypothetical protein